MIELAHDAELQQRLIAAGASRSAEFTWPAAATRTWRVLDAVANGEFFIFTHEEPRAWIEKRHRRLMDGFDSIERE